MHLPLHRAHRNLLALLLVAATSPAIAGDYSGHHSRPNSGYAHTNYSHTGYGHVGSHYNYHRGYPGRGYSTYHLPYGYYSTRYYGSPYYYHGGSWYRPYGARFVVVAPPIGIGISVLPPYYSTVWFGSSPYYYADDTYYTYRPERREYVVTEPPRGEVRTEPSRASEEVFVYPKDGQSEDQQAADRDECHQWAVARTGFDPTRPAGNVAQTDMTSKQADYRRAEAACLDGRGYSVR
jgi:hypothetical protein